MRKIHGGAVLYHTRNTLKGVAEPTLLDRQGQNGGMPIFETPSSAKVYSIPLFPTILALAVYYQNLGPALGRRIAR